MGRWVRVGVRSRLKEDLNGCQEEDLEMNGARIEGRIGR
jgi:hypothetical protein